MLFESPFIINDLLGSVWQSLSSTSRVVRVAIVVIVDCDVLVFCFTLVFGRRTRRRRHYCYRRRRRRRYRRRRRRRRHCRRCRHRRCRCSCLRLPPLLGFSNFLHCFPFIVLYWFHLFDTFSLPCSPCLILVVFCLLALPFFGSVHVVQVFHR